MLNQLTAAERPEDALSSTWDSISQLARRIRQVFWLEDPDAGEIVYLSPSFDLLWGRSRADFTGKPPSVLLEAVHPDDRALVADADKTVRAAQKQAESMGILPGQGFDRIGSMFEDVYSDTPWHLAEQRDAALGEARIYLGRDAS